MSSVKWGPFFLRDCATMSYQILKFTPPVRKVFSRKFIRLANVDLVETAEPAWGLCHVIQYAKLGKPEIRYYWNQCQIYLCGTLCLKFCIRKTECLDYLRQNDTGGVPNCLCFNSYFTKNFRWFNSLRSSDAHMRRHHRSPFRSDNELSPVRRQAIIWTNADISSIGSLGTNFSEILIEIQTFSLKKMHWKMSSAKWRLFCLGHNVLISNELALSFRH